MTRHGLRVDLPVSWLTVGWWDALSLAERGAYTSALMYSQSQRLDGKVPRTAIRFLDGDTEAVTAALDHAVQLGRMVATDDGWTFIDWTGMQEQSSAAQIEADRERNRRKVSSFRDRQKVAGSEPVTGNATGDDTGSVGKDRTGKDRSGEDRSDQVRADASASIWRTAVPGSPGEYI